MPEPDRNIEKQLEAYADKRRREAGPPFEMHPATRRMLLGEVSRRKAKLGQTVPSQSAEPNRTHPANRATGGPPLISTSRTSHRQCRHPRGQIQNSMRQPKNPRSLCWARQRISKMTKPRFSHHTKRRG